MADAVHVDLSEIVAHPLRSGIQRVEREALRHWPGPAPLLPCRVDGDGRLLRLPDAVLEVLCRDDDGSQEARAAERLLLEELAAQGTPVRAGAVRRLLNLELFFGTTRAEAHIGFCGAGAKVLWYVYDFLPYLHPGLFPSGVIRNCMDYLRALRAVPHLAFLSEQTRQDYVARVIRRPAAGAPVLLPGADSLALERQEFAPERRDFVAIGTVEPRKNPLALLRAFAGLWERGLDVPLVVAGRISPDAVEELALMRRFAGDPRLTVLEQPPDAVIRRLLRGARAVVMPSELEGFGLPPYEAMHAGIPSIASAALPSVGLLPAGVLKLPRMDPDSIAVAVESLLDDAAAERLWREAAGVRLPGWADFGKALGEWAQAA